MNKKLIAILASTAMMAAAVPSVFADDAVETPVRNVNIGFKPQAEAYEPGTEAKVDVTFKADGAISGGELRIAVPEELEVVGFEFNKEGCDTIGFDQTNFNATPDEGEPNFIMLIGMNLFDGMGNPEATDEYVLGTLTVKIPEDAVKGEDTYDIDLNTAEGVENSLSFWDDNMNMHDATLTSTKGTIVVDEVKETEPTDDSSTPEPVDSTPDDSKADPVPVVNPTDDMKPADETPAPAPAATAQETTKQEDKKTESKAEEKAATTTTTNPNTGAATAMTALGALAVGLVVVSKKRK